MTWNDDSWRDSYDEWKLRSPYDKYPEEECDHEDYEADILSGRAQCCRCGHAWYQTKEELEAEQRHAAEYAEWEAMQHRKEQWAKFTFPIRRLIYRVFKPIWPRKWDAVLSDDEIPF